MRTFAAVFICGALLCAAAAFAAEMPAEKMLSFADSLFAQGDYYRAITEYERVIFFYPDGPLAKTARFQVAESYFKGEKFDQAIAHFGSLAHDYPNEEVGIRSLFRVGEVFYQKRDYEHASESFIKFIETYPKDKRADDARMKLGWSHLQQGNWSRAGEEFHKLPPGSPLHKQAEGLAEEAKLYPGIPKKSPTLAGGLSAILPGAGQLYTEKPGDALISFLLNGTFIWATAQAFHNHNTVTGGILVFFETGWYFGNIYNAVNNAHKYNRRAEQKYMDDLQTRFGISYYHDGDGRSMLAFSLRF
jgi:TM2 domain-containing membrane protein YozV